MAEHTLQIASLLPAAQPGTTPESPGLLPSLLVGFGIILAVFMLLRHQWRRQAARASSPDRNATPTERIESIRTRASGSETLHTTMAEAVELAQRLGAELDNKAERLEQLLAEADRTVRRLEGAASSARPAGRIGGAEPDASAEGNDEGADPATRQIYELADQGLEPVEIARRLDQHLGKVQLILALRRA